MRCAPFYPSCCCCGCCTLAGHAHAKRAGFLPLVISYGRASFLRPFYERPLFKPRYHTYSSQTCLSSVFPQYSSVFFPFWGVRIKNARGGRSVEDANPSESARFRWIQSGWKPEASFLKRSTDPADLILQIGQRGATQRSPQSNSSPQRPPSVKSRRLAAAFFSFHFWWARQSPQWHRQIQLSLQDVS